MTGQTLAHIFATPPFWFAALVTAVFVLVVWGARLLTAGGAVAAFLMGTGIYGWGGGKALFPMLTFFLTSSLLSRFGKARKQQASVHDSGGACRDGAQVWANGGAAFALILLFVLVRSRWPDYWTRFLPVLYLAALATVNADTWATEIGKLSPGLPRLLSTGKTVPRGTSGAVSLLGLLAAFAGAAIIPLSARAFWKLDGVEFFVVTWAGFLGSLADSILGASVQALYRVPETGQLTERKEVAGQKTVQVRGLARFNNDMVNFAASVAGVLAAWFLLRACGYPFL